MKEGTDDRMHGDLAVDDPAPGSHRFGRSLDLGQIAHELNAIAAELRGEDTIELPLMSADRAMSQGPIRRDRIRLQAVNCDESDVAQNRVIYADYAREAYATRRRRATIFGNPELFGEPAWDILLDLYIAHAENKPVSVSSACIGSAAPPTTGLRWLGVLAEHGLVMREHDPEDQRRVLVHLTEEGLAAMDKYFASAGLSA